MSNRYKKIIILTLLLTFAFSAVGYPKTMGQAMIGSAAEIIFISMKYQVMLYALCAFYYSRFNRWPQNKEELVKFYQDIKDDKENGLKAMIDSAQSPWPPSESLGKEIGSLSKTFIYELRPFSGARLLIEGGFNQEITENIAAVGFSKCLFSTVGRKTPDGFSFTASDKNKGGRDYLSVSVNFKVKK